MIKKIHYCWFGGNELPSSVKKCIATWKKYLPDYEIKEWNEKNFDINMCPFVKGAYENKKWAFVSDYVRIYALYNEGGIYFDTDVKIINDVSSVIDKEIFLGFEDSGYVGTAVIGVNNKNNKYIKEILDYYNKIENFNSEIMYNYANPVIITKMLKKYDSYINEQGIKIFDDKIYVYPRDYFYPISYDYSERIYTNNTCMVHLFNATWVDKGEKRTIGIYRKFGPDVGSFLNNVIMKCSRIKHGTIDFFKNMYNKARMTYSIHFNRSKRVNKFKSDLINKNEDYIAICNFQNNKENEYLESFFGDNIVEIKDIYTDKESKLLSEVLIDSNKKLIIFNSYSYGMDKLITNIKLKNRNVTIKILFYGDVGLLSNNSYYESLNRIIDLYNKGCIDSIGFFSKNLYNFYKNKNYNCEYLVKDINIKTKKVKKSNDNFLKIGIYDGFDTIEKNSYAQLYATSLFENSKVDYNPLNYKVSMIARKNNINLNGTFRYLSKEELQDKMSNNDINLFISLVDDSNILPLESLELGTICLVGSNYNYFVDTDLEEYLVVKKEENINEIYNKINYALKNEQKIFDLYKKWKIENSKESKKSISKFLNIDKMNK